MGIIMKYLKRIKTAYILTCIAFIIVGLILLIYPELSMITICYIIGIMSIVFGIIKIFAYFSDDKYNIAFQFDLALGLFNVIVGIIILVHPSWIVRILPLILGVLIIVNSLFSIQASLDAKRFGMKKWFVLLIFSILSIAMGIVLVFYPFNSAVVLTMLYGAGCILTGTEKLIAAIYTTQRVKNILPFKTSIDVDYDVEDDADEF
ncbi:HdeD family acid-resistance protein [Eubacterium sp.]|uniref:HdeD family acid-resistance protein n=1 Tax=Eubacterium sp. TaxID=142586 RepID=UPI003F010712